jgi:hypothetical protein
MPRRRGGTAAPMAFVKIKLSFSKSKIMTELSQYNINLTPTRANQLLLKPVYSDPFMASDFTFHPDLAEGFTKKMLFLGEDVYPLRAKVGCGFNPTPGPSLAEKNITSVKVAANKEVCADEFRNSIAVLGLQLGIEANNLSNTTMLAALQETWARGVQKHINQLRWFGSVAHPGAEMNFVNGYWRVYIPQAVNNGAVRVSDYSNQPLGSGDGIDILKTVHERASLQLKGIEASRKVIYISGALYEQFLNDIENGVVNTTIYISQIENGVRVIRYRGIELRPMWEWDQLASTFMGLTHANLVVYTVKGNLQWGSDVSSVAYRSWYDENDEVVRWKTMFQLGFGLAHEELLTVAY